jgi:ankyrin repeat protein
MEEGIAMEGIWRVAEAGDLAEVQRLVGLDPGLRDAKDENCSTPLSWASWLGHVEIVRWLLDRGAAVNEQGCMGRTPLGFASEENRTEVVRLLMERGADPAIADDEGCTPLMGAAGDGHVEVVRFLLGHPIAVTTLDLRDTNGVTALWWACGEGFEGVARALLESGADPAIADQHDCTPLMEASSEGHLEVLRLLLGHPIAKTTVNHRDCLGRTALWWACFEGRVGVVRALLESGADLTIADNDGTTPMAIAKQIPTDGEISAEGRRECVAALKVRSCLLCLLPTAVVFS